MKREIPNAIDSNAAAFGLFLYFAATLLFLPRSEYLRAIGSGLVVFGAVAALSKFKGRGWLPGGSVLLVGFVAFAVLVMPTFPAMGGTELRAVPIGFVGVQAAILLWACLQWPYQISPKDHVSLFGALKYGFIAAAGISLVATVPVLLVLLGGDSASHSILLVYPAYFVGFLSAAFIYWALQRIGYLALGRYMIGVLGGICIYGAVGPVVFLFEKEPIKIPVLLAIAAVAGGFVGPALALDSKSLNS
jgi:hypothetical protein